MYALKLFLYISLLAVQVEMDKMKELSDPDLSVEEIKGIYFYGFWNAAGTAITIN